MAKSSTGEYTAPLFKVVTIALLCSWLLALTVTPLLCVTFLRVKGDPNAASFDTPFYRRYRAFLERALRQRLLTLGVMLGILTLALFGFRFVPNIFFPENDRPLIVAELELPFGTAIEHTARVTQRIDDYIDVLAWIEDQGDAGTTDQGRATVQAFARARNVGVARARRAFVKLERAGRLVGHGSGARRFYARP